MENENMTQVEKILSDIQNSNLTFENYKRAVQKIDNTTEIIIAQNENNRRDYEQKYEMMREIMNSENFKRTKLDGLVSLDSFKLMMELNRILKDTISWESMKSVIFESIYKKMLMIMEEADGLSLRRDTLKEMKEMENERNKVIIDTLSYKMGAIEDKMDNKSIALLKMMHEENRQQMKDTLNMFGNVIKGMTQVNQSLHDDKFAEIRETISRMKEEVSNKSFPSEKVERELNMEAAKIQALSKRGIRPPVQAAQRPRVVDEGLEANFPGVGDEDNDSN